MNKVRVNVVTKVNSSLIRREVRGGIEYVVLPSRTLPSDTVMNDGLYGTYERDRSYMTLEGTHAPLGHPQGASSEYISATHPDAVTNGYLIGAKNENVRLSSDGSIVLLDKAIPVNKAMESESGKRLLDRINDLESGKGAPIHTSTGLTVNVESLEGETDSGERYTWVARDMQFDHDAILLDEPGANTPEQNVGIFANSDGSKLDCKQFILNVDDESVKKPSKIEEVIDGIRALFAGNTDTSYNKLDNGHEAETLNNNGEVASVDKKKMMGLMKNMGMDMKDVENMDEEAMYNGMMDYSKNMGKMKDNADDEDEEKMKKDKMEKEKMAKNSADQETPAWASALVAEVEGLKAQVSANAQAKTDTLAEQVSKLAVNSIPLEEAKKLSDTFLKSHIAANGGQVNVNAAGGYAGPQSDKPAWDIPMIDTSEAK